MMMEIYLSKEKAKYDKYYDKIHIYFFENGVKKYLRVFIKKMIKILILLVHNGICLTQEKLLILI